MNHIENMGWITSLVFTKSGIDCNTEKDFGQFRLETIETDYQALEIFDSNNATSSCAAQLEKNEFCRGKCGSVLFLKTKKLFLTIPHSPYHY